MKNEATKLEIRIYHLFVGALGFMMLGVVGFIALNAAHIPVIDEHIANIDKKVDEGFSWQSRRLDDHEGRIRSLERSRR